MKNLFFCGALLLATGLASGQESLWGTNHRAIIVNTKASGANVQTDVANFPLLVRLDSANASEILAGARPDGGDLRVTDATGMDPVAFELEHWSATQKRAALWILAPLVKGNDSAAAFRLYWGREGAASVSNPQAVFDTARGFQAVFHFGEGTNDTGYDATANAFRAAPYNAPHDTLGAIGRARKLNGADQLFQIPNSVTGPLNFQPTNSFTLSAWVRLDSVTSANNSGHGIIGKHDRQYLMGVYAGTNPKPWHFVTRMNNNFPECVSNGGDSVFMANDAIGSWQMLTVTQTGAAIGNELVINLYLNGRRVNQCVTTYQNDGGRVLTHAVTLGAHSAASTGFNRHLNGVLDEVRMENRARDANWVKLSHATQRPGGNAVIVAQPGGTAVAKAPRRLSTRLEARRRAGGLEFVIGAHGETKATRARLTLAAPDGSCIWSEIVDFATSRSAVWNSGHAPAGLYFLRVDLMNASGRVVETERRAIPFTP